MHEHESSFVTNVPEAAGALFPDWMPDSRSLVYASTRGGVFNLYAQSSSTAGGGRPIYQAVLPVLKYPTDVTSDGRYVVLRGDDRLLRLSLADDRSLEPLSPGVDGRISPDGRWLAYTSHEGAAPEVSVTNFPDATERWRVSTSTGESPQWRRDGAELFYVEGRETLTAVPVLPGREFRMGVVRPLFHTRFPREVGSPLYAAAADGQRFLVSKPAASGKSCCG